jgi:hypothetical protein
MSSEKKRGRQYGNSTGFSPTEEPMLARKQNERSRGFLGLGFIFLLDIFRQEKLLVARVRLHNV